MYADNLLPSTFNMVKPKPTSQTSETFPYCVAEAAQVTVFLLDVLIVSTKRHYMDGRISLSSSASLRICKNELSIVRKI